MVLSAPANASVCMRSLSSQICIGPIRLFVNHAAVGFTFVFTCLDLLSFIMIMSKPICYVLIFYAQSIMPSLYKCNLNSLHPSIDINFSPNSIPYSVCIRYHINVLI